MDSLSTKDQVTVIAVGNPGAGKSTFINALANEVVFPSGINIGQGLTYKLNEVTDKNGYKALMDTPGLADVKLRKQAGEAISQGLRKGGKFVVLFFVTQQDGRVSQEDATTMKLVLQSAPEIGQNYGVIVNKIGKGVMKILEDKMKKFDFINTLFAALPDENTCVYHNVLFFERAPQLEEEENQLMSPHDLKGDGVEVTGVSLQKFVDYLVKIAAVTITKDKVGDIQTDKFDEMVEIVEQLQREMATKDEEWRREKMRLESERSRRMFEKVGNILDDLVDKVGYAIIPDGCSLS